MSRAGSLEESLPCGPWLSPGPGTPREGPLSPVQRAESTQLSDEEGEPTWDLISKLETEKTQAPNPQ